MINELKAVIEAVVPSGAVVSMGEPRDFHTVASIGREVTVAITCPKTSANKWMEIGDGWTDEIKDYCRNRCGKDFGEPPCYNLAGTGFVGGVVKYIIPCSDCKGDKP